MTPNQGPEGADRDKRRRIFVFTGGFLWQRRIRAMLTGAGFDVTLGMPGPGDLVGVWGDGRYAQRGLTVAAKRGAQVVRVEDAFLRSLNPGRAGEPPIGLLLDDLGLHSDPARPSRMEQILAEHPLDDTHLLDRAREGMWRMRRAHLSKYSATDPDLPAPDPGYILVIDQTEGDAAVRHSRGDRLRFAEMLTEARLDHPGKRVVLRTHPETTRGLRPGHFDPSDLPPGVELCDAPVSPWHLLEGAEAVYTLSSTMGFEAILAGHRPVVFGQPFYAGWGLTEDRMPLDRRQRRLTRAQLFAGAMILAPTWFDPANGRTGRFEDALGAMEAQARAWREDHLGWTAHRMRLWKRPALRRFYGQHGPMRFQTHKVPGTRQMVWASAAGPNTHAVQIEDGFLRSRGLGADLVPPLSLVADDLGIYYDRHHESRLEALIAASETLPRIALHRAERLCEAILRAGVSKYNLDSAAMPPLPEGRKVLVVGQVEDDASIRLGAGDCRTNRALLEAARAAHPDAAILFKPHPDVEAGLRPGAVPDAADIADVVLDGVSAIQAIEVADEVWTITSLLGFEALLRDRPVTCVGAPFYAGWGLTRDLGPVPTRRQARPQLARLIHATLIDYPRYHDPVSNLPCSVEVAVERLAAGTIPPRSLSLRLLAKAQGLFASTPFWR